MKVNEDVVAPLGISSSFVQEETFKFSYFTPSLCLSTNSEMLGIYVYHCGTHGRHNSEQ